MRLPKIKPEHAAYRTTSGRIRIGGVVHGIGAEIEDPDGWIWTLVCLLDGTRSPDEAVEQTDGLPPGTGRPTI
ncbi:ThiF family adenylyltransferase, partial [Kitasatospora sp. NPDC093558]